MSYYFKKYFAWILLFAAIVGLAGAKLFQNSHSPPQETLIVGLHSGYPPFEFLDANGKIVGFDIDLAKRIADNLGKTLEIKDMEFEGEILSLKQGKIDLIMSGMDITPSRMQEIFMVPYHGNGVRSLSLIFWKKIPKDVQGIEDLANLSSPVVSVQFGTTPEACLVHWPKIQVRSFEGALSSLMDVKYGKSIANLVEPDVAQYLAKQHPEIKILNVPLPEKEVVLGFGIGISKKNQKLYREVHQIIEQLKASGELKKIENKWFKEEGK